MFCPRPALVYLFVFFAGAACGKSHSQRNDGAASASAVAATPAPSASAAPVRDTWYAGTWSGTYETASHRIDLPPVQGGLPEWKVDDKRGVGKGTLSVTASADGTAAGSTDGVLGKHDVRGAFDGEEFTARFVPDDTKGFAATLVAHRDGARVAGMLEAGSADGHLARSGTFTLAKAAP